MNKIELKIIRNKVDNISALPTFPATVQQILRLLEKPHLTLDEVSIFVAKDPALTFKVLKMVNSAMYGFPGRISSVNHAIMLLGLNVVKGLLLGVSVFEIMQASMTGLWEHSTNCAAAARIIAKKASVNDPDEISVAALLHDIGKVVLLLEFPQEYGNAIKDAEERGILIRKAEKLHFEETHAVVGRLLFEKWHFPANLTEIITFHHKPQLAKFAKLESNIVHFSDILVRARGIGFAGDRLVPAVVPTAFESLHLSEADLREVLCDLDASGVGSEGATI